MDTNLSEGSHSALFWKLATQAAPIIAGRKCKLLQREPTASGYGETSVNMEGVPVVCIAPDLEGDNLIVALLHELAHVKHHADNLRRSTTELEPPRSDKTHKNRPEWELEADNQALEWVRYGMANRDQNLPKDAGILLALVENQLTNKEG